MPGSYWLVPRLHGPLLAYSLFGLLYLIMEIADQYIAKLVFKALLMPVLVVMIALWHRELPLTPTVWLLLTFVFAWGGDLSLGLGTTTGGLCFFAVSRFFLFAAFRWYDQLSCSKVLVSAAFYSGAAVGLQLVIWQSTTQPLGLQIAALFYLVLVVFNGYFFTHASWVVLVAGILFGLSDALIAIRLFDSDWGGLAEMDIVLYVLAMGMFAYDYVTCQLAELKARDEKIDGITLLDDNTAEPKEKVYEFKEVDTAISV